MKMYLTYEQKLRVIFPACHMLLYHLEWIDGDRHSHVRWFFMTPYESTFWGWRLPSILSLLPPAKFNMEPENEGLEEEISIKNHHFQVPC